MKILIAEDSPVTRIILQEQLTAWGYEFDMADNGKEALDYAQKNGESYDLFLTDVDMPVMNGIEAIQAIRRGAYYLPIIACSSNMDYRNRCLEMGADDFLAKPVSPTTLREKLEAFSVKQAVIYQKGKCLSLHRIGPADSRELIELMRLDRMKVTKFTVVDASFHFVAHQYAQEKVYDDLTRGDSAFIEILDRTRKDPGLVQIHASNVWVRKSSLTPTQFRQLVKLEDEVMRKYENL